MLRSHKGKLKLEMLTNDAGCAEMRPLQIIGSIYACDYFL